LLCAGYLFPGAGLWGIFGVIAFWTALWEIKKNNARYFQYVFFFTFIIVIALSLVERKPALASEEWESINTSFGKLLSGSDDTLDLYDRYEVLEKSLVNAKGKYVVLPETVAGWWGEVTDSLWEELTQKFAREGRTFFVGAEIGEKGTSHYRNAVVIRGRNNGVIYQRFPVPISMWMPFSGDGAVAVWFGLGSVVVMDTKRVGTLSCYEPYLYLPCLITMIQRPDIVIAVSNSWWCKGSNLPAVSDKDLESWALLFGTPVVKAKNI
jgi:hypothetical protein